MTHEIAGSFSLHTVVVVFYCEDELSLTSTLFPYTTLFRSRTAPGGEAEDRRRSGRDQPSGAATLAIHRRSAQGRRAAVRRSEEHTSELQSLTNLVCRLLLEKKTDNNTAPVSTTHTRTRRAS